LLYASAISPMRAAYTSISCPFIYIPASVENLVAARTVFALTLRTQ
jgi:hypothetical protein